MCYTQSSTTKSLYNEAIQNHPACLEASHWDKERPDCWGGLLPARPLRDLRTKSFISLLPLSQLPKKQSSKHKKKRNCFLPTFSGNRAACVWDESSPLKDAGCPAGSLSWAAVPIGYSRAHTVLRSCLSAPGTDCKAVKDTNAYLADGHVSSS